MKKFGYRVKPLVPQYIKSYGKTNINDIANAEVICKGENSARRPIIWTATELDLVLLYGLTINR